MKGRPMRLSDLKLRGGNIGPSLAHQVAAAAPWILLSILSLWALKA